MRERVAVGRGERARVAGRVRELIDAYGSVSPDEGFDDALDPPVPAHGRPSRQRSGLIERVRTKAAQLGSRDGSTRAIRLDPGRRGAVAMGVAALVAAVVAGVWVLSARPHASAISSPTTAASARARQPVSSGAATTGASNTSAPLVVDVVGKVAAPGLYRLPTGSRIADALTAAGGALPGTDLSTLNLAQKVADGEQIAVGIPGAPAPVAGGSVDGTPTALVDLNTASAEQLDALPGVGPVLAQHIIDWRTAHGSFDSVDQLREVTGIGAAKFADLQPLVTV